ncbi:hypothetical protein BLA15816_04245 [Burkholderia lata]|nr:hypothetical protein BLA15816_04245 [Burkholderia lata]
MPSPISNAISSFPLAVPPTAATQTPAQQPPASATNRNDGESRFLRQLGSRTNNSRAPEERANGGERLSAFFMRTQEG